MKQSIYIISLLAFTSIPLNAKKFLSDRKDPLSPEEEMAGFTVPEGYVIELVASEKNGIINPIDLTFDDAGRLWTQTAGMYPLDPVSGQSWSQTLQMMQDPKLGERYPKVYEIQKLYKLEKRGTDKILILEDPTKKTEGQLKVKVWADGLTIPQSIMPYKNGCYVAHGSEFFFMSDENNDGKQDKVETLLSGFGFFDTHTMSHSIVRGPGGWINFSQGALNSGKVNVVKSGNKLEVTYAKNLRLSTDGKEFEILNTARDNVWGYQVLSNGQWYATSANDHGLSVLPMEDQTGIDGIGGQSIRSYQPLIKTVHKFRVGGTGISGLAFSEDGEHGFPPAEWKNVAILANPITHSLNLVRIERKPDGTIHAEHLKDFLTSKDDWFRPVNIEFGPDGCLYVADWYNKIVGHNELRTDHPDRDKSHGRIWRIRHKSQKPLSIPNVAKASNADLIKHLQGKTIWEKRAAWHQIEERQAKELTPQLRKIALDPATKKDERILALWSIEALKAYDQSFIITMIADKDGDIRREAIRSLASYELSAAQVAELVKPYLHDSNVMVRSQVLRTLEEIKTANNDTIALLVEACQSAAADNSFGGNYERNFERFLARKALETYQTELKAYLATPAGIKQPAENILWAIQALPAADRTKVFVNIWEKASSGDIDKDTFSAVTKMLDNPLVQKAVAPTFKSRSQEMLDLSIANSSTINGPLVSKFFIEKIATGLKSSDKNEVRKSLDIINTLRSPHHTGTLLKHFRNTSDSSEKRVLFNALGHDTSINPTFYRGLLYNDELSFDLRLSALASLVIKNEKMATSDAKKWLPFLDSSQKKQLVKRLAYTPQGSNLIKALWHISYLDTNDWDLNAATLTLSHDKNDWRAKTIYAAANAIEQVAKKARHEKIEKILAASRKIKGDPVVGKAVFGSCLACHAVGGEGNEFAPPLDGGRKREVEHLLTAIISPDDAVEGAYGLYYVASKNGSITEGYLVKNDSNGITIGQPGGNKSFIAKDNIHKHGSINGRSFMPASFGDFPEKTLIDISAYIRTIK